MSRKIALVGTASSGASAPYNDPSWEIWGVSARADYVTRANRWFELHRLDGEPEDWANVWRATMRVFTHDVDLLYMFYPEKDLAPKVISYPYEKIVDRFGTYFMTSTFSWMMALAIDEMCPKGKPPKPGTIGIWGVDMEYGTEYRQQRVGLRHFVDLARVLGIDIVRLADGGLAYEPIPYPFWQDDPLLSKLGLRQKNTHEKMENCHDTLGLTRSLIASNRTLQEELKKIDKTYDIPERLKSLEKEEKNLLDTSATISKDIVGLEGANSVERWITDYLQS